MYINLSLALLTSSCKVCGCPLGQCCSPSLCLRPTPSPCCPPPPCKRPPSCQAKPECCLLKCQPSKTCRFSDTVDECLISNCCSEESSIYCNHRPEPEESPIYCKTSPRTRGHKFPICCCADCGEEICEDDNRFELSTACTQPPDGCELDESNSSCHHGIQYVCCKPTPPPPPPPPPPRQEPMVIVNNTELCDCESKWDKVERWKEESRRAEQERQRREEERERRERRRRRAERCEREMQRQESIARAEREERRRKRNAEQQRQEKWERDAMQMEFEDDKWIEELCDRQEERKFIEEQERRRDEQKWREEQLRERPTDNMAVPELEEMRRALAPIPKGPHEVLEYFCCEPRESAEDKEAQAKANGAAQALALMGMTKEHGIHLKLSDNAPKKTTVVLNMGPPSIGNKMLNIISGEASNLGSGGIIASGNCGGGGSGNNNQVPLDIQNVMMTVKQITSPLLQFQQSKPHWATLQANLGFPQGLGNALSPYYCNFRNC